MMNAVPVLALVLGDEAAPGIAREASNEQVTALRSSRRRRDILPAVRFPVRGYRPVIDDATLLELVQPAAAQGQGHLGDAGDLQGSLDLGIRDSNLRGMLPAPAQSLVHADEPGLRAPVRNFSLDVYPLGRISLTDQAGAERGGCAHQNKYVEQTCRCAE
jgi:hypothetical protein